MTPAVGGEADDQLITQLQDDRKGTAFADLKKAAQAAVKDPSFKKDSASQSSTAKAAPWPSWKDRPGRPELAKGTKPGLKYTPRGGVPWHDPESVPRDHQIWSHTWDDIEIQHKLEEMRENPIKFAHKLADDWTVICRDEIAGKLSTIDDRRHPWFCGFYHRRGNYGAAFDGDCWHEIPWELRDGGTGGLRTPHWYTEAYDRRG